MKGIYKITNKNNGKIYIGQANNIKQRIAEHKQKRNVPIDMVINCLGVENFEFEILEECFTQEELDNKEKYYIKEYDSINNGYNIQKGGFNNSVGEGNGRAKLTEQDVIAIRTAYNNHEKPSKVYEEKYKEKISQKAFQSVWQGQSWAHIMPEVFTKENKDYYIRGMQKETSSALTKEELISYRKYYSEHSAKDTYLKYLSDKKDEAILKENTFKKILVGDVRDVSFYKTIPIYSKKRKQWELNGNPVMTILVSEE